MNKNIDRDVDGLAYFAQQVAEASEIFSDCAQSLFNACNDLDTLIENGLSDSDNNKAIREMLDGLFDSLTKITTYAQFGQELSERVINSCNMLQETDSILHSRNT